MHAIHVGGAAVPALGLGTYGLTNQAACDIVREALDVGYRHIDTAQMYGNEDMVGKAVRESSVRREDLFITTKVWLDKLGDEDFLPSVEESLRQLRMDYVDLLLIHWPNPMISTEESVRNLVAAHDQGYARHIGVSNFPSAMMTEAQNLSGNRLINNQVEYHVYLDQKEVLQATRKAGAFLTAYSPVAKGQVFGDEVVQKIARAHQKNEAQIALRWLLQQEQVAAIPRSSNPDHVRSNFEVFDFELTKEEMERLGGLCTKEGRIIDPHFAPAWD